MEAMDTLRFRHWHSVMRSTANPEVRKDVSGPLTCMPPSVIFYSEEEIALLVEVTSDTILRTRPFETEKLVHEHLQRTGSVRREPGPHE